MKKSKFCLMAMAAIMMVGCSKEEFSEEPTPTPVSDLECTYLGRGYNSAAHYAVDEDVMSPVLSLDLLAAKGYIDTPIRLLATKSYFTFGKDLAQYESRMSECCSLEGNGWGFKASLKESFSTDAINTKENSFCTARYSKEMVTYRIFTNITVNKLKECLSERFKNDLTSMSVKELLDAYGTHVIVGYTMGGKLEFSISAMNENNVSEDDFKLYASAGYSNKIGGVSGSADIEKYNKFKNEAKNITEIFQCRGGQSGEIKFEGDADARRAIYNEWDKSLNDKENQVLIQFPSEYRGLIPLNKLIDDPSLSKEVADSINKRLMNPIEQSSGIRKLKIFFKEIDTRGYNDSNGFCRWKFTMTAQPVPGGVGREQSVLFNTYSADVTVPGGGLGGELITDSGNCGWSGTRAGIDFKNGRYGAHDQDAQRKALAWGEPVSREYKLYRCEDNTVQLQVKNLLQYNKGTSNDNMADINVNLTCQRNSDCWKYYKGTTEMSVYDRNSGENNIELIGSSTKHSGEYVKFLLELEWK